MKKIEDGFNSETFQINSLGYILCVANIFALYVRVQEQIPALRHLHLPGILSLALLIWVLLNFKKYTLDSPPIRLSIYFFISLTISAFGAVNFIAYSRAIQWIMMYFPIIFMIYLVVCNSKRFYNFYLWWIFIHFLVALIVFKNGGTGPGDFMLDENDTALGLGMCIPIAYYFSFLPNISNKQKYFTRVTAGVLILAIIITQSRGGLVGLFCTFGTMWLFSKRKLKIFSGAIFAVIVFGGIAASMLPKGYIEDVTSGLSDPEDSTRKERVHSWEIARIMYADNILFGVGAGNFPWNVGKYQKLTSWWTPGAKSLEGRQVHSMYFEVLADLGSFGVLTFFGMIILTISKLNSIRKKCLEKKHLQTQPDLIAIVFFTKALIASMACFLISGFFISVTYYPHIALWVSLSAITIRYFNNIIRTSTNSKESEA